MKKVLLMSLSMILVAAMAMGITVAYLQDSDSAVNVMTLGNVYIEQHEYERDTNADGTYKTGDVGGINSYILKVFTQDKPLMPIVGDPSLPGNNAGYAGFDTTTVRMSQVGSYGGMDVFAGKNAQDKFVTVENTGKSDAFVRTLVAVECGATNGSLTGTSYHSTWTKNEIGIITVDGNNFLVIEYTYAGAPGIRHENGVLPAGDTSYPNLSQVYLKSAATNQDMEKIDGNGNGTLDILVLSQAIQTAGFENAKTALDTGFGKSADKAAEWFGGIWSAHLTDTWDGTVDKTWFDPSAAAAATPENPVTFEIDTAEEFAGFVNLANTNDMKNVTFKLTKDIDLGGMNWNEGGAIAAYGPAFSGTLDGNGHSIVNLTAENNWTYANALFRTIGNDVTIKNLTIEGANINNAAASGKNKEYGIHKPLPYKATYAIDDKFFDLAHTNCDRIAIEHPLYEPACRMQDLVKASDDIVHHTFDAGEGVLIPGEILHHAKRGCRAFVILQPFGCLPNHVVGRGIVKDLKSRYPDAQILPLDYDPDVSFANVENRLQMLIMNARAHVGEHLDDAVGAIAETLKSADGADGSVSAGTGAGPSCATV